MANIWLRALELARVVGRIRRKKTASPEWTRQPSSQPSHARDSYDRLLPNDPPESSIPSPESPVDGAALQSPSEARSQLIRAVPAPSHVFRPADRSVIPLQAPTLANLGALVTEMLRAGEDLMASIYHLHASVLRREPSSALDHIFRDIRQAFRNLFGKSSALCEAMDRIGRNVNFFVDHVRTEDTTEEDRHEYIEGVSGEIAELPRAAEAVMTVFEVSRDVYSQSRDTMLRVFVGGTTRIRLLASAKASDAASVGLPSELSVDVTHPASAEEGRVWAALLEYGRCIIALEQMLRGQSFFLERWRSQLPSMAELDQLDRLWKQAARGGLANAMADFARLQDALVPAHPPAPDASRSAQARTAWSAT